MDEVGALRRRATKLVMAGKHKRAIRLYERVLELSPRDAQAAHRLGELRRKVGDLAGAQMSYWRAAELFRVAGLEDKARATERVMAELTAETTERSAPRPSWWRSLFRPSS